MISRVFYHLNVWSANGSPWKALTLWGGSTDNSSFTPPPAMGILDNDGAELLDNDGAEILDNDM